MPRPPTKTSATSLKMTPAVRELWEQCAAAESRTLSNMFEVMVRDYAKRLGVVTASATPKNKSSKSKH